MKPYINSVLHQLTDYSVSCRLVRPLQIRGQGVSHSRSCGQKQGTLVIIQFFPQARSVPLQQFPVWQVTVIFNLSAQTVNLLETLRTREMERNPMPEFASGAGLLFQSDDTYSTGTCPKARVTLGCMLAFVKNADPSTVLSRDGAPETAADAASRIIPLWLENNQQDDASVLAQKSPGDLKAFVEMYQSYHAEFQKEQLR